MTTIRNAQWIVWLAVGILTATSYWAMSGVPDGELKFKAQLIWGTDYEKPANNPKIKELDKKLREKIRKVKIFRWKNYFEVDQENFSVRPHQSAITSMSHKCVIELKHLDKNDVEVRLYGQGQLVNTVRQCLPRGEYLLLAGDDKDKYNDMWIVAISRSDP